MLDPDKIKKGLACCIDGACALCPYYDENDATCSDKLLRDSLNYTKYLEDQWGEMVEA